MLGNQPSGTSNPLGVAGRLRWKPDPRQQFVGILPGDPQYARFWQVPMRRGPESLSSFIDATPRELEAVYDDWSEDYDADLDAWGYCAPDVVASRLAARGLDAAGTVLDAGCGTGRLGAALRSLGFDNLLGVDVSGDSLARAQKQGVYRNVVRIDLTRELPFVDDRFEAVVSTGVFTYVPDGVQLLNEFLRLVRPGGSIVFSQRSDLWAERSYDALLSGLERDGRCSVSWSEPQPYLPRHPEYGDEILAIFVEITARS